MKNYVCLLLFLSLLACNKTNPEQKVESPEQIEIDANQTSNEVIYDRVDPEMFDNFVNDFVNDNVQKSNEELTLEMLPLLLNKEIIIEGEVWFINGSTLGVEIKNNNLELEKNISVATNCHFEEMWHPYYKGEKVKIIGIVEHIGADYDPSGGKYFFLKIVNCKKINQ